jgi:high-affinity nickel-transport protein
MSLVDTLDSILMLYAYAQPDLRTGGKLALFERDKEAAALLDAERVEHVERVESGASAPKPQYGSTVVEVDEAEARRRRMLAAKTATMGSLSISLTLLSIFVALAISLIEIMGLIGENCQKCTDAAEAEDGGGLAGSWWRAWAKANDASGYVGAAIVGVFVLILVVYHGARWWWKKRGGEGRALARAEVA